MNGSGEKGKRVVVVGCGVIGLTSAIRLQEEGYSVRIVARDIPPCTTSNKAGAIWEPYRAYPEEKVAAWAAETYTKYRTEYGNPRSGVSEVELTQVGKRELERPFWLRPEYPYRELGEDDLPRGYSHGFGVRVPFISSTVYLDYLLHVFAANGGDVEARALRSLAELPGDVHAIVNCSGLGARELVSDPQLFGIRGQLAIVSRESLGRFLIDDTSYSDPVYVLPRGNECVLGGTAEERRESTDENRQTRDAILSRCRELEPAVAACRFLRPVIGVRPGRDEVRLEAEPGSRDPLVLHNYGHGGSGFTVSWGCANEVARLLRALSDS